MPNREFTLNHKFEHFLKPECTPQLYSPEEEHFGVKWKISILQKGDRFLIYLCADLTKNQEVHIQYNAKICANDNHDRRTDTIAAYSFSYENDFPSGWASIERRTLNHVFSNDGKLEVEFHVKIIKLIGYRKELRSFGEDMKQFSDAVLVVDEQKLYVSKLYLSSQSSHFANLFKRQVEESKKPEIMWTGINPYYLQYYLEVILGEDRIDEDTVEAILQISDKCNTLLAKRKCERYLIEKSKMELKNKLELAGRYRLEMLKKKCLDQIKSRDDIRSVIPEDTRRMNPDILSKLLDKALAFD